MRLLVFRFSAMGDVALLTPVLNALARKYSNLSITLVTRKAFEPFFYNLPGVEVIGVDVDQDYSGLRGLYRLYRELKILGPYNFGVDIHGSARSRILKFFFRLNGLPFATLVKGRREKIAMTRRKNKIRGPLPHMVERYMRVFERAGVYAEIGPGPWINPDTHSRALAKRYLKQEGIENRTNYWIGIAPFAKHRPKTWPIGHTIALIRRIRENLDATIFLFGGGPTEIYELGRIQVEFPDVHVVAGKLSLEGEMALMLRMHVTIVMDSFNMHLASLLGTRVLSLWGPTHHFLGFGPYGQDESSIIEISPAELPCRPCSVFGNKPCFRKDLACLNWITPQMVYDRLVESLEGQSENTARPTAPELPTLPRNRITDDAASRTGEQNSPTKKVSGI